MCRADRASKWSGDTPGSTPSSSASVDVPERCRPPTKTMRRGEHAPSPIWAACVQAARRSSRGSSDVAAAGGDGGGVVDASDGASAEAAAASWPLAVIGSSRVVTRATSTRWPLRPMMAASASRRSMSKRRVLLRPRDLRASEASSAASASLVADPRCVRRIPAYGNLRNKRIWLIFRLLGIHVGHAGLAVEKGRGPPGV